MNLVKKICNISILVLLAINLPAVSQGQLLKKIKDKANAVLSPKPESKPAPAPTPTTTPESAPATTTPATTTTTDASGNAAAPTIKAYQNYDFVPGDKIIFEDHFDTDEEGEFPAHWHLAQGQATMNTFDNHKVFLITDYNSKVIPAIKTKAYLTDSFTIEFDTYSKDDYGPAIGFYKTEGDVPGTSNEVVSIILNDRHGNIRVVPQGSGTQTVVEYPPAIASANYINKWHHIAIAYKNKRLKIYVDQYRVISIPEISLNSNVMSMRGEGQPDKPVMFANFKLSQGAGIKTQETKFTDTKIVTHGINFDIDKATIKPESMGTLNQIVGILKNNPDIKFEIQGHTDNSGAAAHNLALSQQRADAVKLQLVSMGVDEGRLSTKGLGDTKPIADNSTPEGKANNRRVEFITLK